MSGQDKNTEASISQPLLGQVVILTGSLAITAAGLWYLYMGQAPYHPETGASAFITR